MSTEIESLIDPPESKGRGYLTNEERLNHLRPKIERIQAFSPDQYEDFTLEWVHGYLKGKYKKVLRNAGSGDLGRDIVAYFDYNLDTYDNYQCKRYTRNPLMPSNIWIELGKLVYYTFTQAYSRPQNYYFVSPLGCGPDLKQLLSKPSQLNSGLIENWDEKITSSKVPLNDSLKDYINEFDFSIVQEIPPLELIEQHSKTNSHFFRFGGLTRPKLTYTPPPDQISSFENNYINALYEAYSDFLKKPVQKVDELPVDLSSHLNRQRISFYCAETLKQFSRDTFPNEDVFKELKDEIFDAIIEVVEKHHCHGLECLQQTIEKVTMVNIDASKLKPVFQNERKGVCHHLADEGRIKWIKQ